MGSFCDYWENKILDHIFGKSTYTAPNVIYVALSTTTPTDGGLNITEPTPPEYGRVGTIPSDWNASVGGAIDNVSVVEFTQATSLWGDISHFALFDQYQAGNTLAWGQLSITETIAADYTASFAVGALAVSLD